jgi:serine protease Do
MENTLIIGEFEGQKLAVSNSNGMDKGRLGLAVRPLTPDEQRQAEVSGGILVEDAVGPAARAGIQSGDVILSFNGEPIASIEQLRALASKAGKQVALLVQRDNAKIFVPVTLG